MPMRVHMLSEPEAPFRAHLETQLRGVEITYGKTPPDPAEFAVLIAGRPSDELLDASPQLEILLIPYAGLPKATRAQVRARPHLRVHNIHHNAGPAAELAMALLLSASKFIVPMDRSLRRGDWTPRYEPNPSVLLAGKHALVLGFGAIGQRIAAACKGLGMQVTAVRRNPGGPARDSGDAARDSGDAARTLSELVRHSSYTVNNPSHPGTHAGSVRIAGSEALAQLLPRTDALLAALPLTPRTEGMIGPAEIARLPEHAVVVNVGRGPVIDQTALYEALRNRRIRAAGLDVWYNYPSSEDSRTRTPPADHPFEELDNVVLSPHRGGALGLDESELRRMDAIAHSLNQAAAGRPMPYRVDPEEGY